MSVPIEVKRRKASSSLFCRGICSRKDIPIKQRAKEEEEKEFNEIMEQYHNNGLSLRLSRPYSPSGSFRRKLFESKEAQRDAMMDEIRDKDMIAHE